jgi:hypothetical protein
MSLKQFVWAPGAGYDRGALERLRSKFPRPREPMGEAWFMGDERKMYPELAGDLQKLSSYELQQPLTEIASGTSSFGRMNEWTDWYHYLLGQLIPRSHEEFVDCLLEYLVTGFMALYPTGNEDEPYEGFKADALHTLGRCIMDESCWSGSEIQLGTMLHRSNNNPNRVWCWWDASGDFTSSMFFCLKYLPENLIGAWFDSVLAIPSPHWRAQVLVWMLGASDILTGEKRWPSEFVIGQTPSVGWAWSHCLSAELLDEGRSRQDPHARFISETASAQVLERVRLYFTPDRYLDWLTSFDQAPYVRDELANLPRDFEALYVGGDDI